MSFISALMLVTATSNAQDFTFKNPNTGLYELTPWQIDLLYKQSEEFGLLILEVTAQNTRIDLMTTLMESKDILINNYSSRIADKDIIIDKKDQQLILIEDLYNNCASVHTTYRDEIKALKWQNSKLKVKNKWLEWGGGVTSMLLVAIITKELIAK